MNTNIPTPAQQRNSVLRERHKSIIEEACEAHGVSTASIMGISRAQPIAFARQHCYWKMWKAGMNFTDIGKALNRDRTTVRHGVAMIARTMHNQKWLGA